MRKAAVVHSPQYWQAGHGPHHPMKPERLERTYALLSAYDAFSTEKSRLVSARMATEEELCLFHTREYVDAVRKLSAGDARIPAWRYGFGAGDNPVFAGMYETEGFKTGGSLVAAELVVSGQVDVAFNYAGGMHHARPARASGFCVFNDPAVIICWLVQRGLRVAYIDIDAHHGDGVQDAFYDSAQVMTISLHESGRYLFPGSGFVRERGKGEGEGFCVNVPLPPYTFDEPYVRAFREVAVPLVHRFAPDIVVSQLGADVHMSDPLTHLMLSSTGYVAVVEMIAALAPRWVALGGGGYAMTAVPRLWTLAYGVMSGQSFPDELPAAYAAVYEGGTLRDHMPPSLDEQEEQAVRRQVESVVLEIKELFQLS